MKKNRVADEHISVHNQQTKTLNIQTYIIENIKQKNKLKIDEQKEQHCTFGKRKE